MCALLLAFFCTWTPVQQGLGSALLAATVVDFAQTRNIVASQQHARQSLELPPFYETNPILGSTPSMQRVNLYFALVPVLGYLALDAMPSKYRTPALAILTSIEVSTVGHNFQLGIKLSF